MSKISENCKTTSKNKPNHQPRHQFLTTSATPPAPNQQGFTNCPDLPIASSPTLPIEWAGGGSGSAGSIRPPIPRYEGGHGRVGSLPSLPISLPYPFQTFPYRPPRVPPRHAASPSFFPIFFSSSNFPPKFLLFSTFSRFRVAQASIFGHFCSQNRSPEATFSVFLRKR